MFALKFLVLQLCCLTMALANEGLNIPKGYEYSKEIDTTYRISSSRVNWTTARDRCCSQGGNLAVIDTWKKVNYIGQKTSWFQWVWVGIHRESFRNEWQDVYSDLTTSDLPWAMMNPKSFSKCVALSGFTSGLTNLPCDSLNHYICEISGQLRTKQSCSGSSNSELQPDLSIGSLPIGPLPQLIAQTQDFLHFNAPSAESSVSELQPDVSIGSLPIGPLPQLIAQTQNFLHSNAPSAKSSISELQPDVSIGSLPIGPLDQLVAQTQNFLPSDCSPDKSSAEASDESSADGSSVKSSTAKSQHDVSVGSLLIGPLDQLVAQTQDFPPYDCSLVESPTEASDESSADGSSVKSSTTKSQHGVSVGSLPIGPLPQLIAKKAQDLIHSDTIFGGRK